MQKDEILNRYKDEEHLLVSKILDKIELSDKNSRIESTDFLNLNEQMIIKKLFERLKRICIFYGCYENAERKMAFIIPSRFQKNSEKLKINFEKNIGIIRIKLSSRIKEKYTHRNYLGAIMKLGIKREKIGDILVDDNGTDIIVRREVLDYLIVNLSSLNRFKECDIQEIVINELKKIENIFQYKTIQVSSMRLDNIVSEIINTSRSKAQEILENNRVFVNHVNETKATKQIKLNDVITVRGKGRFKLCEIIGKTKKEKINLQFMIF